VEINMTANRITPASLIKGDEEDEHQAAVIQWRALNIRLLPHIMRLHHIPNGAAYSSQGDQRTRMIRGARMKAQGVQAGVLDLCLPLPMKLLPNGPQAPVIYFAGLYIEMKKPGVRNHRNGGASDDQMDWIKYLNEVGYKAVICHSWREACIAILAYYGIAEDDPRVTWE
jgi:hypothetical protein